MVRSVITAARQTDEVRACRVRILVAEKRALADPTQRLSSQVYTALCACEDLAGTPLSDLMTHCHKIYFATEYVKPICSWFVEPRVLSVFIALMKSCTRTLPHQQLLW